jgi:ethanolamine utilization protein EutQ (cupin superfamily)
VVKERRESPPWITQISTDKREKGLRENLWTSVVKERRESPPRITQISTDKKRKRTP